jgi:hypothetical protein
MVLQQGAYNLISDSERARLKISADSDRYCAPCGPPHPMDRQLAEQILYFVEGRGQSPRQRAGDQSRDSRPNETHRAERQRMQRKQRSAAQQQRPGEACHGTRDGDRQKAARPQFEQQKLDGEQHCCNRCAEHGGHAGDCARYQERLPFATR